MELSQVLQALRNADAAGDVEGAKRLAQIAREMQARGTGDQAPDPNKSGFTAAASAGIERLKGEAALLGGKLGVMSEEEAQAYKEEKDRAAQARFTPTQEGWLDAPWLKLKETAGGSVPYMAAPLVVGAAATGLGAPAAAAALLGGAASAAQFTGSNLRAQMDTGKSLKETDAGAAALAAIPQAALDTLSFRMMPGIGKLFGAAGAQVTEEAAKKIAEQSLKKVAADYALSTGKTMGVEGLTEAAQQVFERLQAGLQINDPEARKDYLENFIGGAALAAVLGPLGRYQERGQIKRFGQEKEDERRREELLARGEKKEEAPPAPEFDIATAFPRAQELQAQINALRAQKVAKPKDELEKARNAQIEQEVKVLVAELTPLAQFVAKNRNAAPAPAPAAATPAAEPSPSGEVDLFGNPAAREPAPAPIPSAADVVRDRANLERQMRLLAEETQTRELQALEAAQAGDVDTARAAIAEVDRFRQAMAEAQKQLQALPAAPAARQPRDYTRDIARAGEMGDVDALRRALQKAAVQPDPTPETEDLLSEENAIRTTASNRRIAPKHPDAFDRADLLSAPRDNQDLLGAAREQQDVRDAARRAGQEGTARAADRMATVEGEEQDALDLARQAEADAESTRNQALDQRTEQLVDQLVGALPQAPGTTPPGRIVRGQRNYRDMSREELLAQLEVARATRNREQVSALVQELKDQRRPQTPEAIRERLMDAQRQGNAALAQQLVQDLRQAELDAQRTRPDAPASELASAMGSKLPEGYADVNATNRAVSATTRAFAKMLRGLNDFTKAAREQDLVGAPRALNTADEAGREVQQRLADEVNARRAAQGQAAMTQAEAIKLADQVAPLLKELRERWSKYTEPRIGAQGAQMRANKIVRGATPGSRPEPGQRAFTSPGAAADAIQEQLAQIVDTFVPEVKAPERKVPTGGARVAVPDELQLTGSPRESRDPVKNAKDFVERLASTPDRQVATERVERNTPPTRSKDLKDLRSMVQEPTERTVSETRPADADDLALLQRAADLLRPGQTDDAQFIREQAQRFQQGLPVSRQDLQDYISLQEQGQQSDSGQKELFDRPDVATERTTPQRFAKYLDSQEVQQLRRRLAKDLAQASKSAAAAKEDVRSEETALRKAEVRLAQARAAAQRKEGFVEKWKDEIVRRLGAIDDAWDRLIKQRDELQTEIDDSVAQTLDELEYMGNEDAMAEAQRALDAWRLRKQATLGPVIKDIDNRIQALDKERGDLFAEMEREQPVLTAAETSASRARREQSNAQRAADAATREENKKERLRALREDRDREQRQDAASKARDAAQRAREGMGLPGTRVTRDTTAKAVEKKAKGLKSKIGSLNEEVSRAWTAGDDARAAEFEAQREQAMSDLAAVFQDAPRLRTEILDSAAERKAFAEYEAAQRKLEVQEAKDRIARGEPAPYLDPRRKGAVVRKQSAAPSKLRTASEESLAGQNKTDTRRPLEQSGKLPPVDRNSSDYMAEANRVAEQLRKLTPAQKRKQAKEAAAVEKELAKAQKYEVDDEDTLYQRGQQADGEALSDTAVQALEADNIAAALNNVVQTSKTPINQAVARRLRSLLGNTRVILDPNLTNDKGEPVLGAASGDGMTIWLNPNGGLNEETLLHEAVHAATERVLRTPDSQLTPEQVAAKRELQALFARVKADPSFTSVDAKASLSEFVAEAMTNPVLQEQLARKPWKLQNAWEGFKRVLLKLLGVTTPPGDMLTASLAAVDTIMQAPRPGEVEGGTPAFKRWFGDSKVVDADGKPLVVYHGTTADFSAFSKKGVRPNFTSPQKQLGFFFTDDPAYADRYTKRWGEFKDGANTMPVYLSLQNPKIEPIEKIGEIEDRMKQGEAKAYREGLEAQGFDGIVFEGETPVGFVREFVAFRPTQIKSAIGNNGQFDPANPDIRYQQQRESIIASPRTAGDTLKSNAGLAFRTQAIDRLAPVEKVASYLKDPADAMQAMYYLRTYGQRMSLVSQAVSNGAPQLVEKKRSDGKKEWLIESQQGASLKNVMDELKAAGIKDPQKLERLFTLDLVGRRAANVGWDKLDFENPDDVKAEVDQAREEIKALGARDAFDRAAKLYNMFNKDMLKFMVQTGAISKEAYDALSKNGDYVPFYRQRGGNAELIIGKETPVRIGNLKDSPHLRELLGGSDKILPFSASAVQNVAMLTDMAVRNIGTRNLAFEMASMGLGKIGKGDAKGTNVFTFKDDGVDKYMILDEEALDTLGVPADLLVKGLAGIPTMLPAAMRLLALPSQLLRKSITLSPVYAARQLFRDSTAAAVVSGANITPVFSALKQLGRKSSTRTALERRGITGGQVFTGTGEDISKILRDIGAGKNPMRLLSRLEAMSMEADASTRRAQYDSYRKQGLSEMEATMMSLESMNFTRQGLSPSIHMVGQLVPFMNAQIQGLDVLYRAARGRMPMNERLNIQRKMMARGAMMAALTLAYAAAMQDDEAYKNATPEERAMNWFVRVPGLDEPVRVPIPFEIGYIFKALPEAVMNLALGSQDAKATGQAVNRILINTLPGGSNMLSVPVNGMQVPVPIPMPAAIKPLIEANTGVSLFTRRPIVSGAQADALPEYQYTERTSEIAKDLGQFFGMSPAILENTIRGYMSGTGLAIMQAASMAYGDTGGPERATRRMSELPLIGALFQPNDGLALVNNVYDRLKEIEQVKTTFDNLVKTGERAEAERFLQEHLNTLTMADTAGNAKQMLNRLVQMERAVKASDLSGAEKADQLKELRRVKIELAGSMREVLGTR